jgi:uncharacterized membrane protein
MARFSQAPAWEPINPHSEKDGLFMINKKLPIVSLIFYILAGLLLAFAVWAAVFSFEYISEMAAMGQLVVSDNLFNIASFHMSNFGQYVVFAAVLFGVGWIVHIISAPKADALAVKESEVESMEKLMEELQTEAEEE